MAQNSGFIRFLQKMNLISIEDDGEQSTVDTRQRSMQKAPSSVYERTYASKRGGQPQRKSAAQTRNISPKRSSYPTRRADTLVFYIATFGDCKKVITNIIEGTSVVINLDQADERMCQRIMDTLAGAACALNAKLRKITEYTYLITPEEVLVNESRPIERRY